MRAHELLHWIAPQFTTLNGDAWNTHLVFTSNNLLPKGIDCDVKPDHVLSWSLLCFAVWTSNDFRTPSFYDKALNRDGINAWQSESHGDFVAWLASTVTNWHAATNVANITVNLDMEWITVELITGAQIQFRNMKRAGYVASDVLNIRTISNTATNAGGGVVLWHLAGHFCGLVKSGHEPCQCPDDDVNKPAVAGNFYKR